MDQKKTLLKNIELLRKKNSGLAEKVINCPITDEYTVLESKTGYPVLRKGNITFHSLYDPVNEGNAFVSSHLDNNSKNDKRKILIFGLAFAYHIKPNVLIFLLSEIFILLIAQFTIAYQTIKTARANPVNSLRYE